MRRFNAKVFFFLVCGSALAVAVTFAVHWLQTGRIARTLLAHADRAGEQQDAALTARYLGRYLELEPDDWDARVRLSEALASEKVAVNARSRTRALFALEQVLARLPERHDLRLRLARLALDVQRRDLAREHLTILAQHKPNDGDVEFLFGQLSEVDAYYEKGDGWVKAANWYTRATQHAPQKVDAYLRLVEVLQRRLTPAELAAAPEKPEQVMDRLVASNPQAAAAYLARWRFRQQQPGFVDDEAQVSVAARDIEQAVKLAPDHADVLYAAGQLAGIRKQTDAARSHYQNGRERFPRDVRFWRELAWLELRESKLAQEDMKPDVASARRQKALADLRQGVQALSGEGRAELLWMLGNVLIDARDTAEAAAVIAQMAKLNATPAWIDYLQARLHVLNDRHAEAVSLLERSREMLATSPEVARRADLLLAQCYERLNSPEAQLAAYIRMVSRDPTSRPALLGKAAAHAALGQYDDALAQYQQVLRLPEPPPVLWVEIARLLVLRSFRTANPDLKQIETALDEAAARNPTACEVPLLRAEALLAFRKQGKLTAAQVDARLDGIQKTLREFQQADPKRYEPWAALAALAELRDQPQEALKVLQEAEPAVADKAKLRSTAIFFWAKRGGPEARPALAQLVRDIAAFNPEEQAKLLGNLADAHFRLGNHADAAQTWDRLAQRPESQNDLRLRLRLFEAALQTQNEPAMQQRIAELKRIEGEAGTFWRWSAARRAIWQARTQNKPQGLEEARRLLDAVAAQRPAWPAALVARAEVEELAGNTDQAIDNYQRAITLGERNPRVVRQLVEQLYKRQRYAEAEQEIAKLQRQSPSNDLKRLMVDIVRRQDEGRAAEQAIEAVSPDSTDFRDHLWLGQVLANSGQRAAQAEKHLRRAVDLAGDKPETWLGLVQFLVNYQRLPEAEAAIVETQKRLPGAAGYLPAALCREALGQFDQAAACYQQALKAKPDDIAVLRGAAGFYLRCGDMAVGEPLLRQIIAGQAKATPTDRGWARRGLALALSSTGDWKRFQDALALLGLKLDPTGQVVEMPGHQTDDAGDEFRARIRVLARQQRPEMRQKAVAMLEEMDRKQKLAADEQFILAQLYDGMNDWPRARDVLRQVVLQSKNPVHLSFYTQVLLRQKDLAEAERQISRLEVLEKERRTEAGAFGSVELRIQLLENQGQGDRALALAQKYAARPGAAPDQVFIVISALSRQKRHAEALQACEQARANNPADRVALTTVALLRAAKASPEQCARAAEWINGEARKNPKGTFLLLQLADLADYQARYEDAEKLYRQVLSIDERNVVALNNLSWHLAQHKGPKGAAEGLTLVNRAIELIGPQPDLLDTRASVYLAQARHDLAIADLERANAEKPLPSRWFHLAQAQKQANNRSAAAASFKKATAAGLKPEQLHPAERPAYQQLRSEVEQR